MNCFIVAIYLIAARNQQLQWFRSELLPVDDVIFRSDVAVIGLFRWSPGDPEFHDSGPIRNHIFVFPRTTVGIQHAGGKPFVAGPNLVTMYNRARRNQPESVRH